MTVGTRESTTGIGVNVEDLGDAIHLAIGRLEERGCRARTIRFSVEAWDVARSKLDDRTRTVTHSRRASAPSMYAGLPVYLDEALVAGVFRVTT